MGEYIFRLPTMTQREEDEFGDLRKQTDENRYQKNEMRLDENHNVGMLD